MSDKVTGTITVPFHGESAYEIAVRNGYVGTEKEWINSIKELDEEKIDQIMGSVAQRTHGYTWYVDTDCVTLKDGTKCGKMSDCMTNDFVGTWFFVVTTTSEAGCSTYPEAYTIDGANGHINLRDYVVWTGERLVRVNTYEAKASDVKNSDGKYSPKSGVDGLFSSTQAAYLTDLINSHWDKRYMPVYNTPTEVSSDWTDGYLVNWCRATGWYLGGFAKNCGGHPPVVNNNHTSWILLVLVGTVKDGAFPHALQVAFDLSNCLMYMRKGWLDSSSAVSGWAETWAQVGSQTAAEQGSSVVFAATEGEIINLDNNSQEIVVQGENINFNILFPEKTWRYWRCIVNFADVETAGKVDVGLYGGVMFGGDCTWESFEGGKTYMIVRINNNNNPSGFVRYEIDNITHEIVE